MNTQDKPTTFSSIRTENGIVIGNVTDKANAPGIIARKLVENFDAVLMSLLVSAQPRSLHEVGCGEGRLSRLISNQFKINVIASDFSTTLIEENNKRKDPNINYLHCNVHDLQPDIHSADVVICCEVLEHVEFPEKALQRLASLNARKYIFSVPREPIWRALNVFRGKYWADIGNTPGHINHWSKKTFSNLLSAEKFIVEKWANPFPWLMTAGFFSKKSRN